jgi:hypothetical protein
MAQRLKGHDGCGRVGIPSHWFELLAEFGV